MKKNTASQTVGAQLTNKADGTPCTTGTTTVYVTGDGGTQAAGSVGSGACAHEGNGFWTYAPAQAETNYDHVAFTFVNSAAINATVQVYPSFPQTGDNYARLGAPAGASVSADVAAVKGVLPAALVSGRIDASVGAMAAGVLTAAAIAGDAITAAKVAADVTTEIQTGLATASSIAALPTAAGIADAVWDEAISGHSTAGSTGKALQDAGGAGTPPTAAEVADAVWDEALSGHATAGSAGKALTDVPSASGNATAVWSEGTRLLTAGTNIVLAKGTGVTGFNDPTAAATASAVRTELGVELGRVDVATSTRLAAGDYTAPDNGSIAAIEAQTNNLTFGVTGRVSVNVTHVNATEVTGNGQTGNEWGPL